MATSEQIASSPESRTLKLGIFFIILTIAAWISLDQLEKSRYETEKVHLRDKMEGLLPLLRSRSEPWTLTVEFLREVIGPKIRRPPQELFEIISRLKGVYGDYIKIAIFDKTAKPVFVSGFPKKDLPDLGEMGRSYSKLLDTPSEYNDTMNVIQDRLFKSFNFLKNASSILAFQEKNYQNEIGLFLLATLASSPVSINHRMRETSGNQHAWGKPHYLESQGNITIFIPAFAIENHNILSRLLNSSEISKHLNIWAGPPSKVTFLDGVTCEFIDALEQVRRAYQKQGTIVTDSVSGCFVALPQSNDWIILHHEKSFHSYRIARSPCFLLVLIAFISLLCRLWLRLHAEQQALQGSMSLRFLQISFITCLLPTCGLLWTLWSRSTLDRTMAREYLFRKMETRMEALEQRHNKRVQEVLTSIKQIVNHPIWSQASFSAKLFNSLNINVRNCSISDIYALTSDSEQPLYIYYDEELGIWSSEPKYTVTKNRIPIMHALLLHASQKLKLGIVKEDMLQKSNHKDLQAGLIFDSVLHVLGAENILRLFAVSDRIIPLEMLGESGWSYVHVARDRHLQARQLIFIIINRNQLQRRNFLNWLRETREWNKSFPSACFMTSVTDPLPLVFPDYSYNFPIIETILRQTGRENGVQRLILPYQKNGEILCLARNLRGSDLVIALLGRLPEDSQLSSGQAFGLMVLVYPFLVLWLAYLLFKRFLITPLCELTNGAKCISTGKYDVRLPILTDDEIGQLCTSFNRMADGLREKEFLRRFISDLTMTAINDEMKAVAQATRVQGTILTSDIRSFTSLSEKYKPEEVVEMLNTYMTKMEEVIETHAGTIEKFIGDAILAVFLPMHGRDHPARRACHAALAMQKGVEIFNLERKSSGKFCIQIGVGIASGELLMGLLGRSDGRRDFTVTGPTINRSAAMEKLTKLAKQTKVVVCPSTAELIAQDWQLYPIRSSNDMRSIAGFELGATRDEH